MYSKSPSRLHLFYRKKQFIDERSDQKTSSEIEEGNLDVYSEVMWRLFYYGGEKDKEDKVFKKKTFRLLLAMIPICLFITYAFFKESAEFFYESPLNQEFYMNPGWLSALNNNTSLMVLAYMAMFGTFVAIGYVTVWTFTMANTVSCIANWKTRTSSPMEPAADRDYAQLDKWVFFSSLFFWIDIFALMMFILFNRYVAYASDSKIKDTFLNYLQGQQPSIVMFVLSLFVSIVCFYALFVFVYYPYRCIRSSVRRAINESIMEVQRPLCDEKMQLKEAVIKKKREELMQTQKIIESLRKSPTTINEPKIHPYITFTALYLVPIVLSIIAMTLGMNQSVVQ